MFDRGSASPFASLESSEPIVVPERSSPFVLGYMSTLDVPQSTSGQAQGIMQQHSEDIYRIRALGDKLFPPKQWQGAET